MSLLTDSMGLPRHMNRSATRNFNIGALTSQFDELAAPARLLRLYFQQRAELKAARRALEQSLKPKVKVHLHCKSPDGGTIIHLVM